MPRPEQIPQEPTPQGIERMTYYQSTIATLMAFIPIATWLIGMTSPITAILALAAALHLCIFHRQRRPDNMDMMGMNQATISWHAALIFTNITAEIGLHPMAIVTALIAIGTGISALMIAWQIYTRQFTL